MTRVAALLVCAALAAAGCKDDSPHRARSRPLPADAGPGAPALPALAGDAGPGDVYAFHRARARAASQRGAHDEALDHYARALAALPDDPIVVGELGWVVYRRGDTKRAVELLEQAARTGRPYTAALALDNIGRIHQAAGNRREAARAYALSLLTVPDGNVARRRATMADEPVPLIATRPMRGPMRKLSSLCDDVSAPDRVCAVVPGKALADPPRPISEATTFVLSVGANRKTALAAAERSARQDCGFAVRTRRGWYADLNLAHCSRATATRVVEIGAIDARDGRPAVRVVFEAEYRRGPDRYVDRALSVCGIGASGDPSCTIAVPFASTSESHDGIAMRRASVEVDVTATNEHIVVTGSPSLDGDHPIEFP